MYQGCGAKVSSLVKMRVVLVAVLFGMPDQQDLFRLESPLI